MKGILISLAVPAFAAAGHPALQKQTKRKGRMSRNDHGKG